MDLDKALLLTKAWCDEAHESFGQVQVSSNGDFRGVLGAPEIAYSAQDKTLRVQGLIDDDASVMIEYSEVFDKIKRAGQRESYTLGEGCFFIDSLTLDTKTPQLTLRKDFVNGSITPKQFVKEVNWLMRWSTYWRLQRSYPVMTTPEAELIEEAPGIEAKLRKDSPRPW